MKEIMQIVQVLEDSNILLNVDTKTIKNETKEQRGRFSGTLLRTLEASLLENMSTGKWILRVAYGNKKGKGVLRKSWLWIWRIFDQRSSILKKIIPRHLPSSNLWITEMLSEGT